MKENALKVCLLCWLMLGMLSANAQSTATDLITMRDGKLLKGKIVKYQPGGVLVLQQEGGEKIELNDNEIARIQQSSNLPLSNPGEDLQKEAPTAKTHGLYTNSMLTFAGGSTNGEGLALGAGFSQILGYQLKRTLGLGGGVSIDNYSRRGETVYPIFGEVRYMLPSKKASGNFFATLAGGYALAFPRESLDIKVAEGGPMGQVTFGYRAATHEGVDIYIDLGAKYQKAHFERTLYNGDVEVRDIDFRRIVVRVGIGLWKGK